MISKVDFVGIPSTDAQRSRSFYVDTLGFETRRDAPISPTLRWIEVAPAGANASIALTPSAGAAPESVDTGIRFTVPDAAAEHASMQERGVNVGDLLTWAGVPPMFSFDDPDGNRFYVVEAAE